MENVCNDEFVLQVLGMAWLLQQNLSDVPSSPIHVTCMYHTRLDQLRSEANARSETDKSGWKIRYNG